MVLTAVLAAVATVGVIAALPRERVEVKVTPPRETVALRPAVWTFEVKNAGASIADLGLRLDGADNWMAKHSVVTGESDCRTSAGEDLLLCGPLHEGETRTLAVTAAPTAPGSYSYEASFCDCSKGRRAALADENAPLVAFPGAASRYIERWNELVLLQPVVAVSITDVSGNALAGVAVSVPGTSVSATTASTGIARLGLGPLSPGPYKAVAARLGYADTTFQVTVPEAGDAPAVSIEMPSAAGQLARGSDPGVLPGPILVADEDNNRLLEISPQGQVLWEFPRPGDLAPGQTFETPDDAFFSPDGTQIIATQEENFTVSLIDVATHRIVWRYGQPGVHGSGPDQLWNPDDATVMPNGDVLISDIRNCRIIVVAKGGHDVLRRYGQVGSCYHRPPLRFGSPNGAFPLEDGNWLITEINGDWASEVAPGGTVLWSVHPPLVAYPSDTNEIGPNRYLTVDYEDPGQVVIFDRSGHTIWRYRPTGAAALNHPSLAIGLPNGDILVNDDANDRIIVVDPRTDKVVWQYGVTGHSGSALGFLDNPDGVDLAPPYSMLSTHAATLKSP